MARFERRGDRVLDVHLAGDTVRARSGSMVAYSGSVTFKSAGLGGGEGFRAALKRKATGESLPLMEMSGHGLVHLAADGMEVAVLPLGGDTLTVESSALLALDAGLRTDVKFAGLSGASSGQGLFTTTVTGQGTVALLSDGPPIALEVAPSHPVVVDPDAFVASVGQLTSSFVTGVTWRSAVAGGSGEAFSIRFDGHGLVYIQPAER